MAVDRPFLGTGWSFPPEFSRRSKEAKMVSEEDDIRESLGILLSTTPGERIMQPTYGCALKSLVFESLSEGAFAEIRDAIEKAVLFFETRIDIERIEIDGGGSLEGLLGIRLHYRIRKTNVRSNMVHPFYHTEGTNIATG